MSSLDAIATTEAPVPSRGETVIAPGVLATVARMAAREVDGVEGVSEARPLHLAKRQAGAQAGTRHTAIELRLAVHWPRPVANVATAVRERVRDQVRALTGYEVTDVDITVDRLAEATGRRPGRRVE